ncbi:unnamed protein product [Rhizopus stolonifer]
MAPLGTAGNKEIMNLSSYEGFRQNISMSTAQNYHLLKCLLPRFGDPIDPILQSKYKSFLSLSLMEGFKARKAETMVGIVERTAQHYVKLYRDDEEKRLPGLRKSRIKWHMKLEPQHTNFLCTFYGEKPEAILWQSRQSSLQAFLEIKSISLSGLHKHLVQHASLTLKKLERIVTVRAVLNNLNLCKEKSSRMDWENKCVFIDEAGFNMHIRKNFGRSTWDERPLPGYG